MKIEIPSLFAKTNPDKEFWSTYNALKGEFVNYFRELLNEIDLDNTLLINDVEIYQKILASWNKIEKFYSTRSKFNINRFKGIVYEILFWYSVLKNETLFKQGWSLYLSEDSKMKEIVENTPIRLEIVPLYEPKPTLYIYDEKGKIVDRLPQIQADFLILYAEALNPEQIQESLSLEFIDVKASLTKKTRKIELEWQNICAGWFGCSFRIAYPKKEYPSNLEEWQLEYCPLRSLNKND